MNPIGKIIGPKPFGRNIFMFVFTRSGYHLLICLLQDVCRVNERLNVRYVFFKQDHIQISHVHNNIIIFFST